jgi:hypothetical protein
MIQGLEIGSSRPSMAVTGKKHKSITIDEGDSATSRNMSHDM